MMYRARGFAPISVTVSSGVAISAKSTSKTAGDHIEVFNLAVDGGTKSAGVNVVSVNSDRWLSRVRVHEK
jgi:hypothetical protein